MKYNDLVKRYGKSVSEILMKHITEMKAELNPMDGFGIMTVCRMNDTEDKKRYQDEISRACDGSSIKTFNIKGELYKIYIEYE